MDQHGEHWQWIGTEPERPSPARRSKAVGVAAALILVGGATAGGVAFGFAHSTSSSSAAGIAAGGSEIGVPGQLPTQGQAPQDPLAQPPSSGNGGQEPHQRRDGRASSYIPPGRATSRQQVGVVDIYTRLKYESAKAAGTGMILSADGEILTNNHVIERSTRIRVTVVTTGNSYAATVVGTDKVDDVAVLQLAGASGLGTITPDTGTLHLGDPVTAVGNAMGVGGVPSAAEGSIVGLNRSITTRSEGGGVEGERLTGMIQVDAHVISGDSGGPLYDADDEVIGMDTAASSSPLQSVGFAIPIAKALSIAERIESGEEGGNISIGTPGFLGVEFRPDSSFSTAGSGALVSGVLRKTPAARIGLARGDMITVVSGTPITSGDQLKSVLSQRRSGDSVSLTWRDAQGGSHTATVTLIDGPAE